MNQDHSLPVITIEKQKTKIKKETHRRARLHWKTISNVVKNSIWDKVESEVDGINIDEDEFKDLFQADLKASNVLKTPTSSKKKGAAVRVIDSKRANNGGIILARLKMTHDQMADAVDRIDAATLTAEQIENVIEYLPTKEERDALEKYMLDGGQDAAEKFDGLCECEKFMVSMMTVKHAKRKVRALLFKLQFMKCMESIAKDAQMIDSASEELVNSTRLRQLLGIILQFGNRLNTAGANSKRKAGAFSLDSLSKLSQAKAFDKKTTFLHYIILIVQRNNELLLKYYDDIPTVLEADKVFWDQCQQDLEEVENQLENVRRIALHESRAKDHLGEMELTLEEEVVALRATPTGMFTLGAIKQVSALREKIEHTKVKCKRVQDYFGESGKDTEPQEIFSAFSSFTRDFRKAKEEV
ncbi:actin-binding FH2, partial [Fragilariopsis cylindrus CCMP1102]